MPAHVISLDILPLFVAHLALLISLAVLMSISKIFGNARKKKPLYKFFPHAMLLLLGGLGLGVVGLDIPEIRAYGLWLDVGGLAIAAAITVFYWDWLPRELAKG